MVKLSIILNSYNMQRELPRTLHTLTPEYQQVSPKDYEVILIDNGSPQPFSPSFWEKKLPLRYHYEKNAKKSPVSVINQMAKQAKGEWLMVCIDAARMFSPGILQNTLKLTKAHDWPFIYTMGLHLGPKQQQLSVNEGYTQQAEDQLLSNIDWQKQGYQLFNISSVAGSSQGGYCSSFPESNAFTLRRTHWLELGGYEEAFCSAGGGLANLDWFSRVHADSKTQPILLLGEATFHQYHGGVASNNADRRQTWDRMEQEYRHIRGEAFSSAWRPALWYGEMPQATRRFLGPRVG